MSKTKPKLIIIDGNALIHRSFHALPPTLRTKSGQLVNAVYGFSSFLLKSLQEFKPEYVVLTLDKKGPTFRHEAYSEYKATRVKAPDELYEQIPLVKEVAKAFNIPIFELSGFEADDLIGTICAQTAAEKNLERIIITGDMDTLQLVDVNTKVYTMSRGLSDSVLYGPEEVRARYNLNPDQIIDYKALRGDPSDNIPGVKGVGEKAASELLKEFETLDKLYEAVKKKDPKIKARTLELLSIGKSSAYLSQSLATINQQAPIKFALSDVPFASFPLEAVVEIFSRLEFRSLLNKVKEMRDLMNKKSGPKGEASQASQEGREKFVRNAKQFDYQLIDDDKKFALFLKKLQAQKSFSLDTETTGLDTINAELLGLSFSWQAGEAYFVLSTKERLKQLKPILENSQIKKSGHNLKFDYRVLKSQGIVLAGLEFDTMIASYLLNPNNRQHSLDALAFSELGFEKISKANLADTQTGQMTLDFKTLDPQKLSLYSCEDADFSHRLYKNFQIRLKKEGLEKLFNEIEMPLISVLGDMEDNGIGIDVNYLEELEKDIKKKISLLGKQIYKQAGQEFNINSPKQLQEILFEKLEISTQGLKKNKTGFSTAEDELVKMKDLHPIISFIQDYRELNKLETTYISALPKMINSKTGRIHSNFNQTIAATGRLSSTEPNLQNIPTKTDEGQKIRAAFVACKGYTLAAFDYSQIELRLAAHISQDPTMIKAFKNGEDIHAATAAAINKIKISEVSKSLRREAKAVNFGILYGQGPHGLSQGAGIPYWQAQEFIAKYFTSFKKIKKMMDNSIKEAQEKGYVLTLFGRRRKLDDINSNIAMIKKSAERMAINTPLQGTAADIIKLAMINAAALIHNQPEEIRMILQVHDELIFEVREDKLNYYAPKIKKIMEEVIKLSVPLSVDYHCGKNWSQLK